MLHLRSCRHFALCIPRTLYGCCSSCEVSSTRRERLETHSKKAKEPAEATGPPWKSKSRGDSLKLGYGRSSPSLQRKLQAPARCFPRSWQSGCGKVQLSRSRKSLPQGSVSWLSLGGSMPGCLPALPAVLSRYSSMQLSCRPGSLKRLQNCRPQRYCLNTCMTASGDKKRLMQVLGTRSLFQALTKRSRRTLT